MHATRPKHNKARNTLPFALLWLLLGAVLGLLMTTAEAWGAIKEFSYTNSRYGFSLTLPLGYTANTEAENGDGITVTYKGDMTLLAYGTMAPAVLFTDCKAHYEETQSIFDEVTYARLNEKESWFVVSGYRKGKIGYVKQFVGKTCTYVIEMDYPRDKLREHNAFVKSIVDSFTPGDMK